MTTTHRNEAQNEQQVIVVGSGLAGLTAAYTALRSGAPSVRLLERAAKPGGNSIKASSGINGAPTQFQKAAYPDRDEDKFFWDDTVRSAGARLADQSFSSPAARQHREKLISVLTNSSADAIGFLTELGVDLSVVAQLGGHSFPRTHRGAGKTPPGAAIVTTLLGKLKEEFGPEGRFELVTECEVTRLLTRSNTAADGRKQVVGVEYKKGGGASEAQTLSGPVVFATGGFAGDTHGLLEKYRPDLAGLPSTNDPRPGAHGLLSDVGASLVDMESVQIHPTGFVDPASPGVLLKFLAAEMLRGEGGILLHRGKRFVNELETREKVSRVIMDLPPAAEPDGNNTSGLRQWDAQLLLDPGATEAAAGHVGFYLWKGLLQKKKVAELDPATRQTISEYAALVRDKKPDGFGRTAFGHWRLGVDKEISDEEEVCIGRVTPITHFTMGGAVISERAQILASELGEEPERPVGGLWAAGEITGGIHGDNRLGGSSLLECVVFGRLAGEGAAAAIKGEK